MQQKKFTVTTAELNAGTPKEVDVTITNNGNVNLPSEVLYINSTECEVGIVVLNGATEKADILVNPTNYAYIPLATSRSTAGLPYATYIQVKKISGTAAKDLVFYTSGYGRSF